MVVTDDILQSETSPLLGVNNHPLGVVKSSSSSSVAVAAEENVRSSTCWSIDLRFGYCSFSDFSSEKNKSLTTTQDVSLLGGRQKWEKSYYSPLFNFCLMSILFSANHGCTVACLSLATTRLGALGAWQSSTLSIFYTASSVFMGSMVKRFGGARNSIQFGMFLYCFYMGSFWILAAAKFDTSSMLRSNEMKTMVALVGAALGGMGAAFMWTAYGGYLSQVSNHYYHYGNNNNNESSLFSSSSSSQSSNTKKEIAVSCAGIFAFILLLSEVGMRIMSTIMIQFTFDWQTIFALYTLIAISATFGMFFVTDYGKMMEKERKKCNNDDTVSVTNTTADVGVDVDVDVDVDSTSTNSSVFYQATATIQLLVSNPKMKYMIGMIAVFGFASAYLNSYVNSEVVPLALGRGDSKYIGVLSAWVPLTAAIASLLLRRIIHYQGWVLIGGASSFFMVALPFILYPDAATQWNVYGLLMIYTFHGIGRATFESTLKAVFVEYFPGYETEGAFGNIILHYGLANALGNLLAVRLHCSSYSFTPKVYCVQYSSENDDTMPKHDTLLFGLLVCFTAVLAIAGYCRASIIHNNNNTVTVDENITVMCYSHNKNIILDNDDETIVVEEEQQNERIRKTIELSFKKENSRVECLLASNEDILLQTV